MIKSISKIFSSHIIVKIIGLANVVIILNFLNVEDFGEYSYYLVLLHLVTIIADPFFSSYLQDFRAFNYQKYNLSILIFPVVLLPVFYIIELQLKPDFNLTIFILFCLFFIFSAVLKSFLNAKERYFEYGLVDVFRQLSVFISTLIVFYFIKNYDYLFLLTFNYIIALVVIIILFGILVKKEEISIKPYFSSLKNIIKKGKYLIIYTGIVPLISFIDSYFVDSYLPKTDLGLYSFSLKIFNISLLLVVPIFTVLNIKQIEIARERGYLNFFKKNIKKVFLFALVILTIAVLFNWIITSYFYTQYKPSFWATNILLCTSFFSYLSMPFSFLLAYRKYKHLLFLAVVGILINIIVNRLFIVQYGIFAAATSTFLALTIINFGGAILSYFTIKDN